MTIVNSLFDKHKDTLDKAVSACQSRNFFANWAEAPSPKNYGETALSESTEWFESVRNSDFHLPHQSGGESVVGNESSPYGFALGIKYPKFSVDSLISNAITAQETWGNLSLETRSGILIEALERGAKHFFEIALATQHTTGQGFVMSFQASGPHSFDRALESIATGYLVQTIFNSETTWTKPVGKSEVTVEKSFKNLPLGVGAVIGCSTFPVWNSVPGLFANLVTGNATIVKPHPKAILPIAILIRSMQLTFAELGIDPHIVQLAADDLDAPITLDICRDTAVKLIDYTGGSNFGSLLEKEFLPLGKELFTEKAGINFALIDSTADVSSMADNLAFSLSLYSGQMCTAPQNIIINRQNIDAKSVIEELVAKISGLSANEKMGPGTLGAIQNLDTLNRIKEAETRGCEVLLPSSSVQQSGFEKARSLTPLMLRATTEDRSILGEEWFGPISFVHEVDTLDEALELLKKTASEHGALSCSVYCSDDSRIATIEREVTKVGVPVAFNFTGPIWVNQSAAYSDFHGTGGNPSGTAAFADLRFLVNRYRIVGVRKKVDIVN